MKLTALLVPVTFALLTSQSHAAPIAWQRDWRTATQLAARQNRPLLVLVTASWCGPCHRMLEQSFPDPTVAARVNSQFVPLVLDVDQQEDLVRQLRVDSMPTLIVMDERGNLLSRHSGFLSASQLNSHLAAFPAHRFSAMGLAARRPISAALWQRSRQIWGDPALLQAPVAAFRREPSSPVHLADAFPGLKQNDTLAAARLFGTIHDSSAGPAWGIAVLEQSGASSVALRTHP